MNDFCVSFIMNLFLITLGVSIVILIMLACSRLFRNRYGAAVKQLLWILLAFRMLIVVVFSNTFFRIDLLDWQLDNGKNMTYEYQYINTSWGMMSDKQKATATVYGVTKDGEMNLVAESGRMNPEVINEDVLPYLTIGSIGIQESFLNSVDLYKGGAVWNPHQPDEEQDREEVVSHAAFDGTFIQRGLAEATGFVYRHIYLIGGIWLGGFLLFWLYHLVVWFYFHWKVVCSRQLVEDEFYLHALEDAADYAGLKKMPRLYFYNVAETGDLSKKDSAESGVAATTIDSPMVTGLFHPTVWLPAGEYSPELLQAVLRHELSHIAHRDLLIKLIYLAANSVHWFNPFAYVMVHQACRDMELYCDAEVVASGTREERELYNEQLYSLLKVGKTSFRKQYFSTCYSGNVREMKLRFLNNLDEKRKRYGWLPVAGLALLILVSGLTVKVTASTTYYTYEKNADDEVDPDYDVYYEDEIFDDSLGYNYSVTGYPYEQVSMSSYPWGVPIPKLEPYAVEGENGFYAVPVYAEDYMGTVDVEFVKVPMEGKALTEVPEISIVSGMEEIIDYAVLVEGYPAGRESFYDNRRAVEDVEGFFASQSEKGEANPLFEMGSVSDYGSVQDIYMYFPEGEMPDVAVVRDVVLNDDGTIRYEGQNGEVVYRLAYADDTLNCVSFGLANHSAVNLYEEWGVDKFIGDPFLRGYQVRCDWIQEDGLYSCTYLFVLRTHEAL